MAKVAAFVAFVVLASCGPVADGGDAPSPSPPPDPIGDDAQAGDARASSPIDAPAPPIDASSPSGDSGSGSGPYRSGTRIKMKMLVSSDGARVFQGNYDSQRAEDCGFQPANDGVMRCLPVGMANESGYFSDAACTQPLAIVVVGACQPKYLSTFVTAAPACPITYKFGPIYSAVSSTPAATYAKSATACVVQATPAGYATFARSGPEIAPESFQAAMISVE